MQRLAEKHKQAETELLRLQERLQDLSSVSGVGAQEDQTAVRATLENKDAQISELEQQLEAQKSTISMMNNIIQVCATATNTYKEYLTILFTLKSYQPAFVWF
jgi:TolA-binding protein